MPYSASNLQNVLLHIPLRFNLQKSSLYPKLPKWPILLQTCRMSCYIFPGAFCRMRVGHLLAPVASMDLLMAVHRGTTDSSRPRVLHPIHRDEPLHHIRYGHRRVLRSRDGHVYPVLAYMERDGEEAKGPSKFAGRQEGQQQAIQLQVVSSLPDNSTLCRGSRNCDYITSLTTVDQRFHYR